MDIPQRHSSCSICQLRIDPALPIYACSGSVVMRWKAVGSSPSDVSCCCKLEHDIDYKLN